MKYSMMERPILITGGGGFLGSHLCEYFLRNEYEVICLDNFFSGSKKNISSFLNKKNFELIRHDIWLPIYLEVGSIFNLACPASPKNYQIDPLSTTKTSVLGAINMLGLAKRNRSRIFQASTSEVYGDPNEHPQRECYLGNVNPIGIRACYDEGKRCAETLFFDYNRQHNVDIRVARIFNTYGPRMQINDGRVVSNFIIQALKNEDITIYGDGKQTRSFCYVDDLIRGIVDFMNQHDCIGPLNLGNDSEITVAELAEKIIKITKSKSKIIYLSMPSDDPIRRKPALEKAKSMINWKPKIELEEGLERTIHHFREELKCD